MAKRKEKPTPTALNVQRISAQLEDAPKDAMAEELKALGFRYWGRTNRGYQATYTFSRKNAEWPVRSTVRICSTNLQEVVAIGRCVVAGTHG